MVGVVLADRRRRRGKILLGHDAHKRQFDLHRHIVADLKSASREKLFCGLSRRVALGLGARGVEESPRTRRAAVAPFPRELVVDKVAEHFRVVAVGRARLDRSTVATFGEVRAEDIGERRTRRMEIQCEIMLVVIFVVACRRVAQCEEHGAPQPIPLEVGVVAPRPERVEAPAAEPLDRIARPCRARDELLDVLFAVAHPVAVRLAPESVELDMIHAEPDGRLSCGVDQPPSAVGIA